MCIWYARGRIKIITILVGNPAGREWLKDTRPDLNGDLDENRRLDISGCD